MISVLMPARNAEITVSTAVTSSLRAMSEDSELIVYDDGSEDETYRVLAKISRSDKRLRIIRGTKPIGVANALNILIGEAINPIIGRMDADDFTFPWRFKVQYKHIRNQVDMVFSNRVYFGSKTSSFRPATLRSIHADAAPYWLTIQNPVAHSTLLGQKKLLVEAGGYREGPAEDYDLWMRLAASKLKIERISLPCIAYRLHPYQVTKDVTWRERYSRDLNLAQSHDNLLEVLGWRGGPIWNELHFPDRSSEHLETLNEFSVFLRNEFKFSHRGFFIRSLARRIPG